MAKVGKEAENALSPVAKLNKEIAELQKGLAVFKANPSNSKDTIAQAERNTRAVIAVKEQQRREIQQRETK